jgi:hypothetical protein
VKKNLGANMALEFRTRDESYKGPRVLPSEGAILQASVFVDHLPPGFPADPYNPYLVNDRYSHRPRYVIDAFIMVLKDQLALEGPVSANIQAVKLIDNTSIEKDGLDILLTRHDCKYQGALYPIPEPTAEALQDYKARQRQRSP